MLLKHLTWIFIGLFVLFGALILTTESVAWRRIWVGSSTLSLSGFAFSMIKDALATGRIRVQNAVISQARQPRLFRAAIILIAATGVVVLVTGIWALFFKI